MSALVEPRHDTTAEPSLAPVPSRTSGLGRVPFLLILAGIVVAGLVGLLLLQTMVQEQSFQVQTLQSQATELAYKQAQLEAQVQKKSTAAEIARQAQALGMAPNPYAVYIDTRTGSVVGTQKAVTGNEVPYITYKTDQQVTAERQSAATPTPVPAQPGDSQPEGTNQ